LARVELPGGKVFSHLLARSLDQPGVLKDALDLLGGGVAADVLFLQHFPEVRPILDAVDDVLKNLILPPRSVVGAEEPVPEGAFLLGYFCSQPPYPLCFIDDSYPKIMNSGKERLHLELGGLPLFTENPRRLILGNY
jgi:hypothetical protein